MLRRLISWPAVGTVQTLIWPSSECSCPQCPAVVARAFSFVGTLIVLSHIPQTQRLSSWPCGFNVQLIQLVGRVLILFPSHSILGAQVWFYPYLDLWVIHMRLLLRPPWRTWACPSEDRWRGHSCLECGDPDNARYMGKPVAKGAVRISGQPLAAGVRRASLAGPSLLFGAAGTQNAALSEGFLCGLAAGANTGRDAT